MPNYHPAPLAPLSSVDAYTSWPGGVDPTVKLYNVNNQMGGKKNRSRKNRGCKSSRKNRNRKASRRNRH